MVYSPLHSRPNLETHSHCALTDQSAPDDLDRFSPGQTKTDWFVGLFEAEDAAALGVEHAVGNQVVNPVSGFEVGVQLEQGVSLQQALMQLSGDVFPDTSIADVDETPDVGGIVVDQLIAQSKSIHWLLPSETP